MHRCCCPAAEVTVSEIVIGEISVGEVSMQQVDRTPHYLVLTGADTFSLPAGAKSLSIAVILAGGTPTLDTGGGAFPIFLGQTINFNTIGNQDTLTGTFDVTTTVGDIVSIAWST